MKEVMTTMLSKTKSTRRAPTSMKEKKKIPALDPLLLILILLLVAFGSAMIFSASSAYAQTRFGDRFYFIRKQLLWILIGIPVMLLFSRIPLAKIKRATPYFFALVMLLLLLVPLIGSEAGGATRWISIGGFSFQPSELAKSALVLMLALYFDRVSSKLAQRKRKRMRFLFGILIPFAIIGAVCALVILEKHLSCTIILFALGITMMFLGGASIRALLGLLGGGMLGVGIFAMAVEYTRRRILIWQSPEAYPTDGGWQTLQGLMAIGSGGFFGLGYGQSRLKHMYVSEPQNDFIFTIACEELGFIGALLILGLFALFVYHGFGIVRRVKDPFARLAALGLFGKVAIQVLLNVAVVTNSLPNTGISLPFFSYGGSSLVVLLAEMGILLSVSRMKSV